MECCILLHVYIMGMHVCFTHVFLLLKTPFVGFTFCTEILLEVCNFEEINFDILGEMAYLPPHEFEEMMSCASEDQVHLEVCKWFKNGADETWDSLS